MNLLNLFIAFLIPGVIGYGGGPGSITIIQEQVVEKYGWLTSVEFNELLSICNALPGPIATKLSFGVGYMEAGILGAIVATIGIAGPSVLVVLFLMNLLIKNKENPKVQAVSKLIMPIIVVLFLEITLKFLRQSFVNLPNYGHTLFLLGISYVLIKIRNIHPLAVIAGAMGYGYVVL